MVTEIKMGRSEYLVYVMRMDVVRVSKKFFERKREGVRKMEIPRLRRLGDEERSCKLRSGGKMTTILKNMHLS
jgi:hypothetical protein